MEDYIKSLGKMHYKVIGKNNHSAVKTCLWVKKSLKDKGVCYKQKFYGIQSHRCLQMTPSIFCNQKCIFCWRSYESIPSNYLLKTWDEPKQIVEESILAHRKLISGFPGEPEKLDIQKYKEAQDPNQVAISLVGEPTMYPYISELIEEYKKKGFTTFVVSNGMFPERIAEIQPTQLYISLDAPDEKTHKKINSPQLVGSWQKLNQSLGILDEKKIRKVIRVTLVKGVNMLDPAGYAKIIKKSGADYIEFKAYMFIGGSRQRLKIENMPYHEDVKEFGLEVNKHLSYDFIDEQPISRVILLSSGKKNPKI